MIVVHVHIRVQPEDLNAFLQETWRNATASLQEPGVRRFDVLRDEGDGTHLVLTEVYDDEAAEEAHNQTSHHAHWQEAVAGMMTEPATRSRFISVFRAEGGW